MKKSVAYNRVFCPSAVPHGSVDHAVTVTLTPSKRFNVSPNGLNYSVVDICPSRTQKRSLQYSTRMQPAFWKKTWEGKSCIFSRKPGRKINLLKHICLHCMVFFSHFLKKILARYSHSIAFCPATIACSQRGITPLPPLWFFFILGFVNSAVRREMH